jgi:hypothetical protein
MIEFYGGYQVYSESGVDLTLLRENLRRSLEERWENNQRALVLARAFEEAGRASRGLPPRYLNGIEPPDPIMLLKQLARHQVQGVIVEGMAMRIHGSAHITDDLTICYRRTADNIVALATALVPLHPCLRGASPGLPFCFDAATIQGSLNLSLNTDLGEVDLLGELAGVGNDERVFALSEEYTLFGIRVRVLRLDTLIASKRAAGRLKDQTHLLELEELRKLKETPPEA